MARTTTVLFLALSFSGLSTLVLPQDTIGREKKKIPIVWEFHETKHYKIEHEKVIPQDTVARVAGELEDILEQYKKLFRFDPDEKLKVKFLDSQNTYEQEGGNPRMAGFYNPGSRYLVIKQMPFYDLIPVVYHEAFHQYLQAYIGYDISIPLWFNEGMATYFESMKRAERTKVRKLDPERIDPAKIRMVQDAIRTRTHLPLEKLLDVSHEEFHEKENEALYYSQSFAVMYFLMKATRGKAAHQYMDELKSTKDPEAANARLFGPERKRLKQIEGQWIAYTLKLETRKFAAK